jgi:hypothetical protein
MKNYTTVRGCAASGKVALSSGMDAGLMVYAGGVVGYSGTQTAGSGVSGCVITGSRWVGETSTVSASGGYPYAGGVVGYNYTGARVARCSAAGTVTATGGNLPYAGGVAGYNSGYVEGTAVVSLIEDCFSTATVKAVSSSKAALAGGIVGANAKRARVLRCYARGAVTAQVTGSGASDLGGSIGVMVAANAGGIAGAQYVEQNPSIEQCAALNVSVTGADSDAGAVWNVYRIAGAGAAGSDTGLFVNNIAYMGMAVTNHAANEYKTGDGKDGADAADEKPGQSVYEEMGWDFDSVWLMDGGYPVLGD